MNLMLSMIRFIAIYNNNELSIIGNPFELISSNETIIQKYLDDKTRKDLMKDILLNPIIRLKNRLSLKTKYFLLNYNNIYSQDYIKDTINMLIVNNNKEKIKERLDYLLNFAENNIHDKNDLLFIINYLSRFHYNLFDVEHLIKLTIKNYLIDNPKKDTDLPMDISTLRFLLLFILTIYNESVNFNKIIKIGQEIYNDDFIWNEIMIFDE
jgi:hypothetical protein